MSVRDMRKKPDAPADTAILVVCEGACELIGGKPGTSFRFVDNDGVLGASFALARKSKVFDTSPRCGCVYRVDQPAPDQFRGPAKWVKIWPDEQQVLSWRAKEDVQLAREREAKSRKAGETVARDRALEALEPIRQQYHRTDAIGRRLLIAAMIEYVQRNPAYDRSR